MRIGIDGRFLAPEAAGLSRYTRELIDNLLKIDYKNQYFLFLLSKDFDEYQNSAKNLTKVKIFSPHYSLAEQIKLPFEIRKYKLDLIHFLNFNHPTFYMGKYVVTIQDLTLFFFPPKPGKELFRQWMMKFITHNAAIHASQIIVPSNNTKKDLQKHFRLDSDKISVIYDAPAANFQPLPISKIYEFKKQHNLFKPFLFYVGQWRGHKNLIRLIEAFEKIKQNGYSDLRLVLSGKPHPSFPDLLARIKKSSVEKDILMPGFVKDEDLPLWYNAASAFVFPSLYEGFGLPPLEALACGTPVISSDAASLPEILGNAVMYFDPENVEEMVKAIEQVLRDKELRKELIKKGFEQIKKFSFEKMARETLKVYNRVK